MVTSNIIEAMVSVKRLSAFFNSDELQPDVREAVAKENVELGDVVVSVRNGEFKWNKDLLSNPGALHCLCTTCKRTKCTSPQLLR